MPYCHMAHIFCVLHILMHGAPHLRTNSAFSQDACLFDCTIRYIPTQRWAPNVACIRLVGGCRRAQRYPGGRPRVSPPPWAHRRPAGRGCRWRCEPRIRGLRVSAIHRPRRRVFERLGEPRYLTEVEVQQGPKQTSLCENLLRV